MKKSNLTGDVILVTGGGGFLGQHVIKHLQERDELVREIRVLDISPFKKKLGDVILVTGGGGFLGQHVIKHLQERDELVREIRVLDIRPFKKKLEYKDNKPVVSFVGNVTDEETLRKAIAGVDCVMHLAGIVSVRHFPETQLMEEVNVKGTQMVIQACIEQNVEKLLFCSTMNVAIGYENIIDGNETSVTYPKRFLFDCYAETKCKAEKAVLKANGEELNNGNTLRTLALRPPAMYGELDPHTVTTILNFASRYGGLLVPLATKNSYMQCAYVGNVSWGFVCASKEMRRNRSLGGEPFFILDDTPLNDVFSLSRPYAESLGYKVLPFTPPYWIIYVLFMLFEFLYWIISPLYQLELPCSYSTIVSFNMKISFVSTKAERVLSYSPLFDPIDSQKHSISFYNKSFSNETK